MAKKKFNEEFTKVYENPSLLTKFDVEEKAHIEVDPVYGDAILQAKKVRDKMKDDFKEQDKAAEEFVKDYELKEKPELPKDLDNKEALKDMKLAESMLTEADLERIEEDYLDEPTPEDSLKDKVADYLEEKIMGFITDQLPAMQLAADIPEYDPEYCSAEPTSNTNRAMLKVEFLVEKVARTLLNVYFSDFLRYEPKLLEGFGLSKSYIDLDGCIAGRGEEITAKALSDMFEKDKNDDPVLGAYDSFYTWMQDNVENGYLQPVGPAVYFPIKIKTDDGRVFGESVELTEASIEDMIGAFEAKIDELEGTNESLSEDVSLDDLYKKYDEVTAKLETNESLEESVSLKEDYSNFLGKPLKDFLKTLPSNEKVNIDYSETSHSGASGIMGRVSEVPWDVADRLIKDIQLGDENYYKFKILTEDKKKDLNEARKASKISYNDDEDEIHRYKVVAADPDSKELFVKDVKGLGKVDKVLAELTDEKLNSMGASQVYVTRDDNKEVYLKFGNEDGTWDVIQDDRDMEKPAEERDTTFNHIMADLSAESDYFVGHLRRMSRKGEGYVGFESDEIGFNEDEEVIHLKSQSDKPINWAKKVAEFYGYKTSEVTIGQNNYKFIDIFVPGIVDETKLA